MSGHSPGGHLRIKQALYEHFVEVGLFTDHKKAEHPTARTAVIECRDPLYCWDEAHEAREKHGGEPVPYHFFGGFARLSPYCPIPYTFYRDVIIPKLYPGQTWTDAQIYTAEMNAREDKLRAIVTGSDGNVQGNRRLKGGGHAPGCGWSRLLGLGLSQQAWLQAHARNRIKERATRGKWGDAAEFEVYTTIKWHGPNIEKPQTRVIETKHPYMDMFPIEQIMTTSDAVLLAQLDLERYKEAIAA